VAAWQAKLQHRIEKALLGKLDLSPMQQIFRSGEIGDSAIVPTRHAERVPMLDSYQPIADIVPGIGAEPIQPIRTLTVILWVSSALSGLQFLLSRCASNGYLVGPARSPAEWNWRPCNSFSTRSIK
jgi:hypothetical protein